jgi:hypothetical protein
VQRRLAEVGLVHNGAVLEEKPRNVNLEVGEFFFSKE